MSTITNLETYRDALLAIKFRLKKLASFQEENRIAHLKLRANKALGYNRDSGISDNRQEMLNRRPGITALHNYYLAIRGKEQTHGHSKQLETVYLQAFRQLVEEFGEITAVLEIRDSAINQDAA